MFKSKAFWIASLAAIVAVLVYRGFAAPAGQTTQPPKKIALITAGSGPYWQAAVAGAKSAADKLGIELDVRSLEGSEDLEQQMKSLSVVEQTDVDAVAISPIDGERQAVLISQLARKIPVVTFDSDAANSTRHGYVGTSNLSAGLITGGQVVKALPEGGKVAVFVANQTKENLIDRLSGLKTRLVESSNSEESPESPKFSVVGVYTDDGDNAVCEQRLRDVLDEHPDLGCVVTLAARQGPVVLTALESLGKNEGIRLIAFDTPEETLKGVEDGKVFAAIAQDPYSYGFEAIRMLDSLCRGDEQVQPILGRASVHISVEPVTKENVEEFRKRLGTRDESAKKAS